MSSVPMHSPKPCLANRRQLLATAIVVALPLLAASGCPKEMPPENEWRKVEPVNQPATPEETARRERAQRLALEAKIKKMRAAFLQADERTCTKDEECTLTPQQCCTCAAGGQQDAVNAEKLPELIRRRGIVCDDYVCPQVVSTHPSCSATRALCREGKCVPDVPAGAKAPEGIGVEPIEGAAPQGAAPQGAAPDGAAPEGAKAP